MGNCIVFENIYLSTKRELSIHIVYSRLRNEKVDCHRFSGMATQCVELLGVDIVRIDREVKSFLFAGKNKTLKISGGAYEVLINYFIFDIV